MKLSTVVKINFLVLALGLTLYAIYSLNQRGLSNSVLTALGLGGGTSAGNGDKAGELTWRWCETRVQGLIVPDSFRVSQKANNWTMENGVTKILDFIAVEKWLASACSVRAHEVFDADLNEFAPAMIIKFVNDRVDVIKGNNRGEYMWRNRVFRSPQMGQAIRQLGQLPEESSPSGAAKQ